MLLMILMTMYKIIVTREVREDDSNLERVH